MEDLSLIGSVTLSTNNSFIYVKEFDLDIKLTAAKVSISGIYVTSNL